MKLKISALLAASALALPWAARAADPVTLPAPEAAAHAPSADAAL